MCICRRGNLKWKKAFLARQSRHGFDITRTCDHENNDLG